MLAAYWACAGAAAFILLRSWGVVSYLLAHPAAFSLRSLAGCLGHLLDCGFTLLLLAGFLHWGGRLLRRLSLTGGLAPVEAGICSCLIGEAVTAFVLMTLGLLGLYRVWVLALVLLALAYGALRERAALAAAAQRLGDGLRRRAGLLELACLALLWAALLRAAAASGSPVTDWDSLGYHLALPKIYLAEGALRRLSWSANAHSPQNPEMISLLCLGLRRDLAAQWVNLWHGVLLALAAYALCRRHVGRAAALPAAALLALQPVAQRVVGNAMDDLAAAAAGLMALAVFLTARRRRGDEGRWRGLGLCGCLVGAALSCKFNGLWTGAALFTVMAADAGLRRDRGILLGAAAFLAGAAVFGLPWYLRNAWTAGNPIWPYYGELFRAAPFDLAVWHRLRDSVTVGVPKTWWNYLTLPWCLVRSPEAFGGASQFLAGAFIPLALWRASFGGPLRPAERLGGAFLVLSGSLWFLSFQEWRYLLAPAALAAVFISDWALRAWGDRRLWARPLAAAALLAVAPIKDLEVNNHLFAFLGLRSAVAPATPARERYLEMTLGAPYVVLRSANALLPADAKVLFFRDARGYYLDRSYAYGDPLNAGLFSYAQLEDAADLRRTLARLGFSHVFYNPTIGGYRGDQGYYSRAARIMEQMLSRYGESLASAGPIFLYRLRPADLPR